MRRSLSIPAIALLLLAAPAATAGSCSEDGLVAVTLCGWGAARVAPPDRFEIASWRLDGLPDQAVVRSLALRDADGPNQSGYVRLTVEARLSDGRALQARATLRGRVMGPALVATRTLRQRETVAAEAVTLVDSDLTTLRSAPLRELTSLEGRVPARTLASGRVLDEALLQAEPIVRRGQPTRAVYRRGALRISIAGTALDDGAAGDTIAFRKAAGGARLSGRVLRDGTVELGGTP